MAQIERRVVDRRMLKLLRGWLRAGVFEGGVVSETEAGTPQGSPISPLLANIALHVLDQAWSEAGGGWGCWSGYADDFVVLCPTRRAGRAGPRAGRSHAWTRSGCDCIPTRPGSWTSRRGAEGFDFLGFHHRMVESWKRRGRWWLQQVAVAAGDGLDPRQGPRPDRTAPGRAAAGAWSSSSSTPCCGVGATTSATATPRRSSRAIDCYVHERLAILASSEARALGANWADRFTLGVARRTSASIGSPERCATDCACLTVNDVGEPCAGEPHARFDRGPLATKADAHGGRWSQAGGWNTPPRWPGRDLNRDDNPIRASGLPHR